MNSRQYLDMLLTARMQARLAVALYAGRNATRELASDVGGTMHWFETEHITAAAIVFSDHLHITVCGSNDDGDWNDNLNACHVRDAGLDAHRGYTSAAYQLLAEIRRVGLFKTIGDRPLVLGGHSAGGAIAQVLAMSLSPREIVTFGSPRVFSPGSATTYSFMGWPVHRFVCSGDPVPHFPLRRFRCLFGNATYAHTSQALHLSDDGEVLLEQDAGRFRRAASLAASVFMSGVAQIAKQICLLPALMRCRHEMDRYAAAVTKAIEKVAG